MWWLIRSPWGRAFIALRENPVRALSLGIDTRRYTLMAFAIGSALGGVAGTLYAPLTQYIDPVPFNLSLSLDLLMMVIVGGAGFFFGPFLGAMIAVLLPEWLRFTEGYYLMLYAAADDHHHQEIERERQIERHRVDVLCQWGVQRAGDAAEC